MSRQNVTLSLSLSRARITIKCLATCLPRAFVVENFTTFLTLRRGITR